jgi:hypothetical protein
MRVTDFCDIIATAEGRKKSAVNAAQMREVAALINAALGHGWFYWCIRFLDETRARKGIKRHLSRRKRASK